MLNRTLLGVIAGGRLGAAPPPAACDPFYDDVLFHLQMNGSDGSNTFVDSTGNLTFGAGGGAVQTSAQSNYLPRSGYFDGTLDSLIANGAGSGAGLNGFDFTIEGWFRPAQNKPQGLVDKRASLNARGLSLVIDDVGGFRYVFLVGDSDQSAWELTLQGGVTALNTWQHVAVTRSGSTYRIFVDGVLYGSGVFSGTVADDTASWKVATLVGFVPSLSFNGYMSDVRVTKGVARYTSSFTPPTAPFPTDQCV